MKITCCAEIANRDTQCHVKTKKRSLLSTLALCRKPRSNAEPSDKDVFLIIITHQNPKGTKYKIHNNVETIFTRFLREGKATLRFKEPPHDVIMSMADPLQLKGFLNGVGLTLAGQGSGKITFSTAPTKVELPKNKLSICERKDYPQKSKFPSSLTWLQVTNCNLVEIEQPILNLYNLEVLDLSENKIKELPAALGQLKIKELFLNSNEIDDFPVALSLGTLGSSLQTLDLSSNKISSLSPFFCLMKNIRVLSLKSNKLLALPRNIHCLQSLQIFSAAHNNLKVLPYGITYLHLETLDLFHNPLNTKVDLKVKVPWQTPSLLELSARTLVSQNIPYSLDDIPAQLDRYIAKRSPCSCGKLVFEMESSCVLVLDLYKLASTVVYINNSSHFKVPLEIFFCSEKCWKRFYRLGKKRSELA